MHWGYALVKSDFFSFFVHIKMSYYWFNRQEFLQKAKDRYHDCDFENRKILKEKARNKFRFLSEEEKEAKRKYGRNRYRNMKENQLL